MQQIKNIIAASEMQREFSHNLMDWIRDFLHISKCTQTFATN